MSRRSARKSWGKGPAQRPDQIVERHQLAIFAIQSALARYELNAAQRVTFAQLFCAYYLQQPPIVGETWVEFDAERLAEFQGLTVEEQGNHLRMLEHMRFIEIREGERLPQRAYFSMQWLKDHAVKLAES